MSDLEEESIELLIYENKKMGDFLELLGLQPNDIISYVVNGDDVEQLKMKLKIRDNIC